MPGGVTDYGVESWLSAMFGVTALPTEYYIALCSDEPGEAVDGDMLADLEPTTGVGYARVLYGTGSGLWAVSGSFISNVDDIVFGSPTAEWGRISHFALCTATSSGEVYAWGEFMNPQVVNEAYAMTIPQGGLSVAMTSFQNPITP